MNTENICGWLKLYTPQGVQVTLPIPMASPADMLAYAQQYTAAGWLVNAPGLEDGEQQEEIGYVALQMHFNRDDGTNTPKVSVYSSNDALRNRFMGVYLDSAQERRDFEQATGLEIARMPVWIAAQPPERGNPQTDSYIVPLKRPAMLVWKNNPNYVPATADKPSKTPKRLFVRWHTNAPPAVTSGGAQAASTQQAQSTTQGVTSAADAEFNALPRATWAGWTKANATELCDWALAEYQLGTPAILTALNVSRISQFKGTFVEAQAAITAHAKAVAF